MRLFTYIFVVCFSSVLFVSCIGCSNDNRTVTENNVYKKTTLWEKETVLRLKIDLSDGRSNYGYFQIEQEGRPIMALDFYSVPTNNGTSVVINARPREDLFTDWQRKKYNEDGNYNVEIAFDKSSKQYLVQLHDVPPGYEDEFANQVVSFSMILSQDIVDGYFNEIEYQQLKLINGTGAGLYFGPWVNSIYENLFWLYAIVFGILALARGGILYHLILTVILYLTFTWDVAPARAFIVSYYVATPLLYIPPVKNIVIFWCVAIGILVSMLILGYRAWNFEGLIAWVFDMVVWGISAIFCGFIMALDMEKRCADCGHFSLSWRCNTKRFELAEEHFRRLSPEGYEIDEAMPEEGKISLDKKRCARCMS